MPVAPGAHSQRFSRRPVVGSVIVTVTLAPVQTFAVGPLGRGGMPFAGTKTMDAAGREAGLSAAAASGAAARRASAKKAMLAGLVMVALSGGLAAGAGDARSLRGRD